jgi:hypothetical protein
MTDYNPWTWPALSNTDHAPYIELDGDSVIYEGKHCAIVEAPERKLHAFFFGDCTDHLVLRVTTTNEIDTAAAAISDIEDINQVYSALKGLGFVGV